MSSNSTCDLFWDSYVRVEYNDTCNFDLVLPPEDIGIKKFWASVILSVVGALFNLWALILLIADYHAPHSHDRRAATSQVTSAVSQHRVTTTSRSKKRSTMQVGLIVFCLFEVFYHTTQATGESIRLYSWLRLSRQVVPPPAGSSLPVEFAVLPITGSVFDCLRDAGICCRNWAITLITIARAEVVVWPLASQFYHRCLRKKRVFLAAIGLITVLSLLLGVLRRLDRTIEVCYSSSFNSYCTTEKPFLMDLTKMTSFYFTYQTLLPWILIFIFTSLIIFKLKPWQKSSETFIHRHNPEAGKKGKAPDSHVRASIAVTVLAAFFTVFELPTFVLCIYFLVVDPNADLSNWTTAANIFLQLDSIANFFLLVLTMPSLRQRARYGAARPPGRSNMSQSDGIKLGETEVISNI